MFNRKVREDEERTPIWVTAEGGTFQWRGSYWRIHKSRKPAFKDKLRWEVQGLVNYYLSPGFTAQIELSRLEGQFGFHERNSRGLKDDLKLYKALLKYKVVEVEGNGDFGT